eukprot:1179949-Prorocentrum_minimum.AAC.2
MLAAATIATVTAAQGLAQLVALHSASLVARRLQSEDRAPGSLRAVPVGRGGRAKRSRRELCGFGAWLMCVGGARTGQTEVNQRMHEGLQHKIEKAHHSSVEEFIHNPELSPISPKTNGSDGPTDDKIAATDENEIESQNACVVPDDPWICHNRSMRTSKLRTTCETTDEEQIDYTT